MSKVSDKELIILASQSPRRASIFRQVGIPFKVIKSDVKEEMSLKTFTTPRRLAMENARRKAIDVAKNVPQGVIIGCDTLVFFENKILGKPKDARDAIRMLSSFSGKWHDVVSGIAVVKKKNGIHQIKLASEVTKVYMRDLQKEEIVSYVATKEPLDKAGSYGIQEKGAALVKKIRGDFYNVVGFPLPLFIEIAKKMRIDLL